MGLTIETAACAAVTTYCLLLPLSLNQRATGPALERASPINHLPVPLRLVRIS